jgi:hypothetical protein
MNLQHFFSKYSTQSFIAMKSILKVLHLLIVLFGFYHVPQAQNWEFLGPDEESFVGLGSVVSNWPKVQCDSEGNYYVAYVDHLIGNMVVVKRFDGVAWQDLSGPLGSVYSYPEPTSQTINIDFVISGTELYVAYTSNSDGLPYVMHFNWETGSWYSMGGGSVHGSSYATHVNLFVTGPGEVMLASHIQTYGTPGQQMYTAFHWFVASMYGPQPEYEGTWEEFAPSLGGWKASPKLSVGSGRAFVGVTDFGTLEVYELSSGAWVNMTRPFGNAILTNGFSLGIHAGILYVNAGAQVRSMSFGYGSYEWTALGNLTYFNNNGTHSTMLVSPNGNIFVGAPGPYPGGMAVHKYNAVANAFLLGGTVLPVANAGVPALALSPDGDIAISVLNNPNPNTQSYGAIYVAKFDRADHCLGAEIPPMDGPLTVCHGEPVYLQPPSGARLNDNLAWSWNSGSCENEIAVGGYYYDAVYESTTIYLKGKGGCVPDVVACQPVEIIVRFPEAETCNGIDDDCNGVIDDGLDVSLHYYDGDGDGYGIDHVNFPPVLLCGAIDGYVALSGDCDDLDPLINPGAVEIIYNGIDDNCNGLIDEVTWTGAVSSNTMDGANWSSGVAPDNSASILVSASAANMLIIDYPGFEFAGVAIESGAVLLVTPEGELTIHGPLVNDGLIQMTSGGYGLGSLITYGGITGEGLFMMDHALSGSGETVPDGRFWYVSSPMAETYSDVYDALGPKQALERK